jgi:hypothetical protein
VVWNDVMERDSVVCDGIGGRFISLWPKGAQLKSTADYR